MPGLNGMKYNAASLKAWSNNQKEKHEHNTTKRTTETNGQESPY